MSKDMKGVQLNPLSVICLATVPSDKSVFFF